LTERLFVSATTQRDVSYQIRYFSFLYLTHKTTPADLFFLDIRRDPLCRKESIAIPSVTYFLSKAELWKMHPVRKDKHTGDGLLISVQTYCTHLVIF